MTDALLQKNTWCLVNSSVSVIAACSCCFISFFCMLLCLHSGSLVLVCTQEIIWVFSKRGVKTTFFSENAIDNQIFSRNSHCNNQLTELWSMCDFLTIWFLPLVFCLFLSLLSYRKLYIENYFTWCLCFQQSLNCEMVSCTVLFCWLLASTSIKWFRSSVARGLSYYFLPLK